MLRLSLVLVLVLILGLVSCLFRLRTIPTNAQMHKPQYTILVHNTNNDGDCKKKPRTCGRSGGWPGLWAIESVDPGLH